MYRTHLKIYCEIKNKAPTPDLKIIEAAQKIEVYRENGKCQKPIAGKYQDQS